MTTPHIGDEDELVSTEQADDEIEQAEQAENTAPPDPADEGEPDEVPREMEHSLPAPTAFNIDATDLYSKWKHWISAFMQFREPRCCIALAPQCNVFSTRSLANSRASKKLRPLSVGSLPRKETW